MDQTAALADHDQIVLATIALAATLAAALVYLVKGYTNSKTAAEQSTAANRAVNGEGPEHRLWDKVNRIEQTVQRLAEQQEEFNALGWSNLPPDLDDAVSLTQTIRALERGRETNSAKIDLILSELRQHVAWEMATKYDTKGNP